MDVRLEVGAPPSRAPAPPASQGIAIDDSLNDEAFLKTLEETLQQHVSRLEQQFLVLSTSQVMLLASRLHDALVPRRDAETRVVEAWTIQPQLQFKVKAIAHIPVLKLSTILREVRRLRVYQSQSFEMRGSPIEVDIFPMLKVVEALNTDILGLNHIHYFARQLRELHIEHTDTTTLRQLLAPEKSMAPWRKLLKLHMNCCALEVVDASVNLLRSVKTLHLGWNKIVKFESNVTTRSLEILNLCHNQLEMVPPIQALRGLRELDLSVNQIASLKGLEMLTALERLDVSHNLIDNIMEVELLTKLSRLTFLKMEFNPVARRSDYRREVLFFLGESIELDGHRWSDPEISSMKNRRMLMTFDSANEHNGVESSMWGQSKKVQAYPRAHVQSGIVVKNSKLVLGYPRLLRSQALSAHFVEIQNPPSTLPTKSNHFRTRDDETESKKSSSKPFGNLSGPQDARPIARTVDDYFRTQCSVVVSRMSKAGQEGEEQVGTIDEEDSDDSATGRTRAFSRKYSTTDFMRDFEEEELLILGSNDTDNVDVFAPRSTSTSQTQISSSQTPGRSVSVRVLLSAKEAAMLDLHFGIDGVPANVDVKARKLVERFTVEDEKKPIVITRWLPDVVAVGASMHSNRAKIITMKLRPRGSSSVTSTAYQFDSVSSLETLLSLLVARLFQQYKGHIVICNCANCRALSLLTPKYPERAEAISSLMVYSCLLCSSYNVREVSFKKLVALCADEGIDIPSSIPLAPPPWEVITEGFYIEEPSATDASSDRSMHECVMVSCNGIREAVAPVLADTRDEVRSDEWNDAIVHAMTTTMRGKRATKGLM